MGVNPIRTYQLKKDANLRPFLFTNIYLIPSKELDILTPGSLIGEPT